MVDEVVGYYQKYLKRIIDVVVSFCSLVVLAPLYLAIAALVKMEDGGDVFYKGVRVGKEGMPFRIYKFRTMVMNAEPLGGLVTSDDDPRITDIGRFLRKWKLDELPQLLNVLKGDMSLVGPRPEVGEYVQLYTEEEKKVLDVRPGITDWASIWDSNEGAFVAQYPDVEKAYVDIILPKKLELQKKYIEEISLHTDVKIVWTSIKVIIARKPTDA